MFSNSKQKDALICDDAVAEVLGYIRQASPDDDNYAYAAEEHLDRLLFTASYIVKNFPVSTKILDIGSFPFFLPGYLSLKRFESICTTDINRPDDFSLNPQWKVRSYKLDVEEDVLPCEDGSLDLVLLLEVFEHLYRRPNHVFREIQRVLKPGGTLIISTPNC
ncbi:MAG: class I SAM-dependent methyltransferase [Betaproteobacteria bacterium]|nr:class I SAM-dependent methyltransferase [Betaproteobacteria bacterium]